METAQATNDEWCPSCGEAVHRLNSLTGFCPKCSLSIANIAECDVCGETFSVGNRQRTTCDKCLNANTKWLRRNADAIERVMASRACNVIEAIQTVYDDNRPRCAMCGDKIKHGNGAANIAIFCKKRDECRRARIRYYRYRTRNNMSEEDALERALHGKRMD